MKKLDELARAVLSGLSWRADEPMGDRLVQILHEHGYALADEHGDPVALADANDRLFGAPW